MIDVSWCVKERKQRQRESYSNNIQTDRQEEREENVERKLATLSLDVC